MTRPSSLLRFKWYEAFIQVFVITFGFTVLFASMKMETEATHVLCGGVVLASTWAILCRMEENRKNKEIQKAEEIKKQKLKETEIKEQEDINKKDKNRSQKEEINKMMAETERENQKAKKALQREISRQAKQAQQAKTESTPACLPPVDR